MGADGVVAVALRCWKHIVDRTARGFSCGLGLIISDRVRAREPIDALLAVLPEGGEGALHAAFPPPAAPAVGEAAPQVPPPEPPAGVALGPGAKFAAKPDRARRETAAAVAAREDAKLEEQEKKAERAGARAAQSAAVGKKPVIKKLKTANEVVCDSVCCCAGAFMLCAASDYISAVARCSGTGSGAGSGRSTVCARGRRTGGQNG